MSKVSIIIGSKSDSSTMEKTKEILDELEISYDFNVISAHRDLDKLRDYVSKASKENIKVFITAAGGAAALPGVVAAMTNLPVIGVPIGSSSLKGIDALMSIVQMPPGIPVGCVALDSWGARNSAIYAASILALTDPKINENITKYKNKMIPRYTLPEMEKVWSESNKYDNWLKVELAVCWALTEVGIIPQKDYKLIEKSTYDYKRLNEILADTKHDMTAFLQSITENLGEESRWIHYGLTTSDIWDTATTLQILQASKIILSQITKLKNLLSNLALENKNTVMMGRTHGIHAEPITLGLKFLLWAEEISRSELRLKQSIEQINVGKISGPVGTNATVSPEVEQLTCDKLKIKVAPVSNQIIQRDRYADFISTLAICGGSLEKFATEIRSLQRTEISELQEPFGELQTGSSSMPHKKNPDVSERICGLSRVLRGNSIIALENISLWGERDISHSSAERIILPDSCFTINYMLHKFTEIMEGLIINKNKMIDNINLSKGVIYSQRLMLTLISAGMIREKAYRIVQESSNKAWNEGIELQELISKNKDVTSVLNDKEIQKVFDINYYLKNIDYKFKKSKLIKE